MRKGTQKRKLDRIGFEVKKKRKKMEFDRETRDVRQRKFEKARKERTI